MDERVRRAFLVEPRLSREWRRLCLSVEEERDCALVVVLVVVRKDEALAVVARGAGGDGEDEDDSADSGTMRRVDGSTRFEGVGAGAALEDWDLGSPRAAAAQERSVERDARSAASWSA